MATLGSSEASSHGHVVDVGSTSDGTIVHSWRIENAIRGRRVLIAVLAFVLAALTVILGTGPTVYSTELQQTADKWAQSLLGKASPIYILPYNSAAEAGKEAADKARQFTRPEDVDNNQKSKADGLTVTGGLLHIIRSITGGTVTPVSKPNTFLTVPVAATFASNPYQIASFDSGAQDTPFKFDPVQQNNFDSNPEAEMVEMPVPQDPNAESQQEPPTLGPIDTSVVPKAAPSWSVQPTTPSADSHQDQGETESQVDKIKEPEPNAFNSDAMEPRTMPVEINVNLPIQGFSPAISEAGKEPMENANSAEVAQIDEESDVAATGTESPVSEDSAVPQFAEIPVVLWSYHDAATGPDQWGKLGYTVCSDGTSQSPINIETNIESADLPVLAWRIPEASDAFLTENAAVRAVYNGRTFEVVGLDALMTIDGLQYTLRQIHVHTPSEHTFDGQHYDMEIHFVHVVNVGDQAKYMIVATLFQKAAESADFIREFASVIPSFSKGKANINIDFARVAMTVLGQMESVNPTITNAQNYFQYSGSFTAPPCAEDVTWIILKNALPVSSKDLAAFGHLEGKNNRPVQPLNGRVVLDSYLSA